MGAFDQSNTSDDIYTPVEGEPNKPGSVLEKKEVDKEVPEQGPYDSVILDNHYNPIRELLTQIAGTSITTQFYHALNGMADMPSIPDITSDAFNHQLQFIKNFKMKLTSDTLSFSKDSNSGKSNLTGEAILYPGFTPTKYDLFILDIDRNTKGLFYIDSVTELSYTRNRTVQATFKLIDYATMEVVKALDDRVVETVIFDKRYLSTDPFLEKEQHANLNRIAELRAQLITSYMNEFYHKSYGTILLNKDGRLVYDDFLVNFVSSTLPDDGPHATVSPKRYYLGVLHPPTTIWDMLLSRSKLGMMDKHRQALYVGVRSLPIDYHQNTLSLSGIHDFVWLQGLEHGFRGFHFDGEDLQLPTMPPENPSDALEGVEYYTMDDYRHVDLEGFYVLSGAFYGEVSEYQTKLEKLVVDYIEEKDTPLTEIIEVAEQIRDESNAVDRFYYYPIINCIMSNLLR